MIDLRAPQTWPSRPGRVNGPVRPGDAMGALGRILQDPELLEVVAQPIVDLVTGGAAGWELLARTPHSWAVPPCALFAAARERGSSALLHERVIREALRLHRRLPPNTFLTVNVDPGELATPSVLGMLLAEDSLARLVVEVTEHAWPEDRGPVDDAIRAVRELGGLIAADDVGAGYAGLTQLLRLRPHFVKIDRELVAALGQDPAAESLVRAVGELSGTLDAWVIVEGVETEIQLAALSRLQVPLAQGWLLGRPGPPFPGATGSELIRHRQSMNEVDDAIWRLMRTPGHGYVRDEYGFYRRPGEPTAYLALSPTTPMRDAANRALARPPCARWTPILVTDGTGRIAGEITMEDLIGALAR